MRRHAFLFGLALVLSHGSLSHGAYAQQADKMPCVGVLINSHLTSDMYQAFLRGLHDLGYFEDKNIAIVAKSAEGNYHRFPEFARELAQLNVNVMVVSGEQGGARRRMRRPQYPSLWYRATRSTALSPA